ncbi:hypothetical protein BpHYR1_020533, partial [Brachionus plicatilis]
FFGIIDNKNTKIMKFFGKKLEENRISFELFIQKKKEYDKIIEKNLELTKEFTNYYENNLQLLANYSQIISQYISSINIDADFFNKQKNHLTDLLGMIESEAVNKALKTIISAEEVFLKQKVPYMHKLEFILEKIKRLTDKIQNFSRELKYFEKKCRFLIVKKSCNPYFTDDVTDLDKKFSILVSRKNTVLDDSNRFRKETNDAIQEIDDFKKKMSSITINITELIRIIIRSI